MNNTNQKNVVYRINSSNLIPYAAADALKFQQKTNLQGSRLNNVFDQLIINDMYVEKQLNNMAYNVAGPKSEETYDVAEQADGFKFFRDDGSKLDIMRKIEDRIGSSYKSVLNKGAVNFIVKHSAGMLIGTDTGVWHMSNEEDVSAISSVVGDDADEQLGQGGAIVYDEQLGCGTAAFTDQSHTLVATDGFVYRITEDAAKGKLVAVKLNSNDLSRSDGSDGQVKKISCVKYDSMTGIVYVGTEYGDVFYGKYDETAEIEYVRTNGFYVTAAGKFELTDPGRINDITFYGVDDDVNQLVCAEKGLYATNNMDVLTGHRRSLIFQKSVIGIFGLRDMILIVSEDAVSIYDAASGSVTDMVSGVGGNGFTAACKIDDDRLMTIANEYVYLIRQFGPSATSYRLTGLPKVTSMTCVTIRNDVYVAMTADDGAIYCCNVDHAQETLAKIQFGHFASKVISCGNSLFVRADDNKVYRLSDLDYKATQSELDGVKDLGADFTKAVVVENLPYFISADGMYEYDYGSESFLKLNLNVELSNVTDATVEDGSVYALSAKSAIYKIDPSDEEAEQVGQVPDSLSVTGIGSDRILAYGGEDMFMLDFSTDSMYTLSRRSGVPVRHKSDSSKVMFAGDSLYETDVVESYRLTDSLLGPANDVLVLDELTALAIDDKIQLKYPVTTGRSIATGRPCAQLGLSGDATLFECHENGVTFYDFNGQETGTILQGENVQFADSLFRYGSNKIVIDGTLYDYKDADMLEPAWEQDKIDQFTSGTDYICGIRRDETDVNAVYQAGEMTKELRVGDASEAVTLVGREVPYLNTVSAIYKIQRAEDDVELVQMYSDQTATEDQILSLTSLRHNMADYVFFMDKTESGYDLMCMNDQSEAVPYVILSDIQKQDVSAVIGAIHVFPDKDNPVMTYVSEGTGTNQRQANVYKMEYVAESGKFQLITDKFSFLVPTGVRDVFLREDGYYLVTSNKIYECDNSGENMSELSVTDFGLPRNAKFTMTYYDNQNELYVYSNTNQLIRLSDKNRIILYGDEFDDGITQVNDSLILTSGKIYKTTGEYVKVMEETPNVNVGGATKTKLDNIRIMRNFSQSGHTLTVAAVEKDILLTTWLSEAQFGQWITCGDTVLDVRFDDETDTLYALCGGKLISWNISVNPDTGDIGVQDGKTQSFMQDPAQLSGFMLYDVTDDSDNRMTFSDGDASYVGDVQLDLNDSGRVICQDLSLYAHDGVTGGLFYVADDQPAVVRDAYGAYGDVTCPGSVQKFFVESSILYVQIDDAWLYRHIGQSAADFKPVPTTLPGMDSVLYADCRFWYRYGGTQYMSDAFYMNVYECTESTVHKIQSATDIRRSESGDYVGYSATSLGGTTCGKYFFASDSVYERSFEYGGQQIQSIENVLFANDTDQDGDIFITQSNSDYTYTNRDRKTRRFRLTGVQNPHNITQYSSAGGMRFFTFGNEIVPFVDMESAKACCKISRDDTTEFNQLLLQTTGKWFAATTDGIYMVQVHNGDVTTPYRITRDKFTANGLVVNQSSVVDRYLCFSENDVSASQNCRMWNHFMSVDENREIRCMLPINIYEFMLGTDKDLMKTDYSYTLSNDFYRFTEDDLSRVYGQQQSQFNNIWDESLKSHVDGQHADSSLLTKLNQSMTSDYQNRDIDHTICESTDNLTSVVNDMVYSIEFGDQDDGTDIKVELSNFITKSKKCRFSYVKKIWNSCIIDIYVYIPTTNTYYLPHVKGAANCSMYDKEITRKNIKRFKNNQKLKGEMDKLYSKFTIKLDSSVFKYNDVIGIDASGNSLPLKIYKDTDAAATEGSQANMFHSFVQPTVFCGLTETRSWHEFSFACFGSDAQAVRISLYDPTATIMKSKFYLRYNANGGSGSGSYKQSFLIPQDGQTSEQRTIDENSFQPPGGKDFIGWTYSNDNKAAQTPDLQDGQMFGYDDLPPEIKRDIKLGSIVDVYALWLDKLEDDNANKFIIRSTGQQFGFTYALTDDNGNIIIKYGE